MAFGRLTSHRQSWVLWGCFWPRVTWSPSFISPGLTLPIHKTGALAFIPLGCGARDRRRRRDVKHPAPGRVSSLPIPARPSSPWEEERGFWPETGSSILWRLVTVEQRQPAGSPAPAGWGGPLRVKMLQVPDNRKVAQGNLLCDVTGPREGIPCSTSGFSLLLVQPGL